MPFRAYFAKAIQEMEDTPGTTELTITRNSAGSWDVTLVSKDQGTVRAHSGPSLLDALSSVVESPELT